MTVSLDPLLLKQNAKLDTSPVKVMFDPHFLLRSSSWFTIVAGAFVFYTTTHLFVLFYGAGAG